jgi:hypothetical protein
MRKAAGLLVEIPPDDEAVTSGPLPDDLGDLELPPEARLPGDRGAKTVEQIVREAEGPDLDQVQVNEAQVAAAPSLVTDGKVDFAAIYKAAGLTPAGFTAEQMLEMLASLPAELPLETRRATVKAMLGTIGKNMGATPETVVADASRKLAALNSFVQFMDRKTQDVVSAAEKEIAELEAQIDAKKTAIQKARGELAGVTHACETESDRLDDVLEFFSLDVGASKYAGGAAEPNPSR